MLRRFPCATLIALSLVMACTDDPTPPSGDPQSAESLIGNVIGQVEDVPAVTIDLPPELRSWDTSAVALEEALAAEDGYGVVAFKAAESPRALSIGRRAAVPAAAIEVGLRILTGRGIDILDYWAFIGAAYVRLPSGVATALRDHPFIDFIEPRHWYTLQGAPLPAGTAVPPIRRGQTTPWGIEMVRAPEAWSVATGAGATIQIIDTGHDRGHEDLPLVPLGNCAGVHGGCDDGPDSWHGTHVLGIFTARSNSVGVIGVAYGVAASDVHVYGACGPYGCDTQEIIDGIEASLWLDVLNMSLGGTEYSADMATAVAQAWNNGWGVVIVAAAGNRWSNEAPPAHIYPAEYANVIGVSGVRTDASFAGGSPCLDPLNPTRSAASNYGAWVDLAAPFWALSTVGNDGYEDENQGWCGTSFAAPHVAGAAALLRQQHPAWSAQQVVDRLFATALPGGAQIYYGHGLVDAAYAVGIPRPGPVELDVSIAGPTRIRPEAICSWEAVVSGGTPPYSYSWYNDGIYGGSGRYYTGGKDPNSMRDWFLLRVDVTDSGSGSGSDTFTVYEDESARMCRM